jgi:hypothetical protein
MKKEIWKKILNYDGYEVSNYGRVRSFKIRGGQGRLTNKPTIKKQTIIGNSGYLGVSLSHKGKEKTILVHRIVLETFVSLCPLGMEARHLDGNKLNNLLLNLKWGTPKENGEDKLKHGTTSKNNKFRAKLNKKQVKYIKRKLNEGYSCTFLANKFNVKQPTISNIKNGKSWTDI